MKNQSPDSLFGSAPEKTSANLSIPPLKPLDTELFRQKLAGLVDPIQKPDTKIEKEAMKQDAIRLTAIFAHLFGDSLDRVTLWERIGSALSSSCAKVSDDDLERFCNLCLEHIQAEDNKIASCEALSQMILTWQSRPIEIRQAILQYLSSHRVTILIHARNRWEKIKNKEIEL